MQKCFDYLGCTRTKNRAGLISRGLNFDTQPIERLTACLINVYYEFKKIEIEQVDVFIE